MGYIAFYHFAVELEPSSPSANDVDVNGSEINAEFRTYIHSDKTVGNTK